MNQRREANLSQPALVPIAGNCDRKPRSLDRDVTSIGRARGSDLCLEANEISTLHCVIYRTSEGYRIRDCNSRTGTRVNGESVKNHALREGDIVNLGPFSFEMRLPPALFPRDGQKIDPARIHHWRISRHRLALRALKFRERLQKTQPGSSAREMELLQKANLLKEKIRTYDHRSRELEESERELTEEREKLLQDEESHREHVREIEKSLADRLSRAEEEIHQRWQQFQQRCKEDETRLLKMAQAAPASPPPSDSQEANPQLRNELEERQKRLLELDQRLANQQHQLQKERQEFLTMKDQWVKDQSQSAASVDKQKTALAEQEAALRAQKTELMRMMGDLKKMQENLRKQSKGDSLALHLEIEQLQKEKAELQAQIQRDDNSSEVQSILVENEKLRHLVLELEQQASQAAPATDSEEILRQMQDLRAEVELLHEELQKKESQLKKLASEPAHGHAHAQGELDALEKALKQMRAENDLLKQLLQEKDQFVQEMSGKSEKRSTSEDDLERYETELNEYRRQLDADRSKLNKEVEMLRERNKELDEAVREMEMEMSKERADLGRERQRLERVRDEIKADMERLQREIAVRDSMAPVQKLRDELTGKQPPSSGKPDKVLNDRLKSFRNQLTDSTP